MQNLLMTNQPSMKYLENKVLTSSPGHLVVLVCEIAVKSAVQGQQWILKGKYDQANRMLCRTQQCVDVLHDALDFNKFPDFCALLSEIYTHVNKNVLEANLQKDAYLLDEPISLLKKLHQSWLGANAIDDKGLSRPEYGIQA